MTAVLMHTNGSSAHAPKTWMTDSVQDFFTAFNWEDHSPEVQELKRSGLEAIDNKPFWLTLSVSQFLSTIDWDGSTIAATPNLEAPPQATGADSLTLDDFSDLF
jgi:hypothetical protein